MPTYEHRQLAPWVFLVLAILGFCFFLFGPGPGRALGFVLAVAICITFIQLTTRVGPQGVSWSFTLGAPGGHISNADIAEAQITQTYLWEGIGIHWSWLHGWLWNVSGYRGVMIRKRDGKRITLGTDDPQGLYAAIQTHVKTG